jgi:predicted transcriptional regulator
MSAAKKLTPADLVQAASSLSAGELEQLVRQLLALRAQRQAPRLSEAETELLLEVNRGVAAPVRERLRDLVKRRKAEQLSALEYEELLRMTEEIERMDGQRLQALLKLAQLRGKPLRVLMDEMGIQPPPIDGLE